MTPSANSTMTTLDEMAICQAASLHRADAPVPSARELSALAGSIGAEVRVVSLRDPLPCTALAILCLTKRRIRGLSMKAYGAFGYEFHDYAEIYHKRGALAGIIRKLIDEAKALGADAVVLDHLVGLDEEELEFLSGYVSKGYTRVFDSSKARRGMEEITSKKSLKRHVNGMRRALDYSVETIAGGLPDVAMQTMAALHKERWGFDGKDSPFHCTIRSKYYTAFVGNKIFTQVCDGREVVACHYGMVFGNVLLWHTPVINIKYLDYSPLEVLLYETAQYCIRSGIEVIDFGLDDEPYKSRFANSLRINHSIYVPVSVRGWLGHLIGNRGPSIKAVLERSKGVVRQTLVRLHCLCNRIHYYVSPTDPPDASKVGELVVVSRWDELVDIARTYGFRLSRWQYLRFKDKQRMLALIEGKAIVSYGWMTEKTPVYVGEIGRWIDNSGVAMLYDFVTPPAFRNKGYYTALLRNILYHYRGKRFAIFRLTSNMASEGGIVGARFQRAEYHVVSRR